MMALRKADMPELFAEFVKFTIFTGCYWWLLTQQPAFRGQPHYQVVAPVGKQATP